MRREFTPIFVGEPWSKISGKGQVSGALPNILRILAENNCIKTSDTEIPKFARTTEEALSGELHTFKV